jgi:hypothetical protein
MRTYTTPLKASSVAFDARGIWYGVVQEIVSYRLKVLVPRLSGDIIYGPLDVVGMNTDTYKVGDPVMIGFLEGRQDELVVIGRLRTEAVAPITNLDDLADVYAPTPVRYQPLIWDGTNWQSGPFNQYLQLGEIGFTDVTELNTNNVHFSPMDGRSASFGLDGISLNNGTSIAEISYDRIVWNDGVSSASIVPLGATNGQILVFDSATESFKPSDFTPVGSGKLDDLADVETPSPTTGQYLQWNGTKWVPASVTAVGSSNLDDLADVQSSSASDGQYLKWNGTKWVPASITAIGSSNLDDLADVQSSSPSSGQYLKWNGSYWQPTTMNNTRTSTSTTDAATANSVRQAHRDAVITFHMEVM